MLQFGVNPLPETFVVKKMVALGFGQLLITFEFVAADGAVIRSSTLLRLEFVIDLH